MSVPKSPELTVEQIEREVLAALKGVTGAHYNVLWAKVLGVYFRNSPENDQKFRQALESLTVRGLILGGNGFYALA
jgi:hypothetical protein